MSKVRAFLVSLANAECRAGFVITGRAARPALASGAARVANFSSHLAIETPTSSASPDNFEPSRGEAASPPAKRTHPVIRHTSEAPGMSVATRSSGPERTDLILGINQISIARVQTTSAAFAPADDLACSRQPSRPSFRAFS
jgi:hypothetical protein